MKIHVYFRHWCIAAIVSAFAVMSLIAWQKNPKNLSDSPNIVEDSVPKRNKTTREPGDKDLDKELRELEKARAKMEELKNMDWDKMKRDIEEALKKIDLEKIRLQAEGAIKQIDVEKIQREIQQSMNEAQEAMSKIDMNKIQRDIEKAMKEVPSKIELEKIKQELEKAKQEMKRTIESEEFKKEMENLRKIDMKDIEKELEKAKKEMERVKLDLNEEKLNMKEHMEKARAEIEKAQQELKAYQEMIYSMEKDGLINTKEDYTIEYNEGELTINGKKQSSAVSNKYKKYFKKDKMTIKKQDGDLNIDID